MASCAEGWPEKNSSGVREVADHDLLEIALTENVQREDLNPIEEAQPIKN